MLKLVLLFAWLFLIMPCLAIADPLDDGAAICRKHEHKSVATVVGPGGQIISSGPMSSHMPVPDKGWEHCPGIINAWRDRKEAEDAADEAKNPELKITRDLAKKIGRMQ